MNEHGNNSDGEEQITEPLKDTHHAINRMTTDSIHCNLEEYSLHIVLTYLACHSIWGGRQGVCS